jgi:hypothetical protein
MEGHEKYTKEVYHFAGQWEMPSHCGILVKKKELATLVVLTEMYESNPGSSVTSMVEALAAEITRKYGIPPETAVFIVRTPQRSTHYTFYAETFYRAVMEWDGEKFSGLKWEKADDPGLD